jgi:hypothetical protein
MMQKEPLAPDPLFIREQSPAGILTTPRIPQPPTRVNVSLYLPFISPLGNQSQ